MFCVAVMKNDLHALFHVSLTHTLRICTITGEGKRVHIQKMLYDCKRGRKTKRRDLFPLEFTGSL